MLIKATISLSCLSLSVCLSFVRLSAWNNSATTERNFVRLYIYIYMSIFGKFVDKIQVSLKSHKSNGYCP